jgi:hypothetical protein
VTAAQLRRRRAAAQRLAGGGSARGIGDVVRHLLAVQAQDLRSTRLALLARRANGRDEAMPEDLAAWSGLPLRDARAALDGAKAPRLRPPARLPPRLLPAFDPYLLGWRDRSFAVAPEHAKAIHPGGGMLRATILVGGHAAGTWTFAGGKVELHPFAPLPAGAAAALQREARRITPRGEGDRAGAARRPA